MVCCSYRLFYLLYEICYYTWSVAISVADPVSDLLVAILYFNDDKTVFGICTLLVTLLPGFLLSALSLQWIIYDTTLASKIPQYCSPQDYTHYFYETPDTNANSTVTSEDKFLPENNITVAPQILPGFSKRHNHGYKQLNYLQLKYVHYKDKQDVVIHPPETMDTVEVDSTANTVKPMSRRAKRNLSEISVDAGISRYPLIITGATIDRKHAYYKTYEEFKINPVKPTWSCQKNSVFSLIWHLFGFPGVPRYTKLLLKAIKIYKTSRRLNSKYSLFVQDAKRRGIKEVYFNKDLLELYHGRRDAALLRLVEGALEATPQLLLQLYIIVKHTRWATSWFTYTSVVFSFISVTWSMTSYIYEHRAARYDKASLTFCGYMCTGFIKLCMCLSRITAILLAAMYSGYVLMGVLLTHWIVCLIYVCLAKTHFYGGLVWNEGFFKFIVSITLILTFMNIDEGRSRVRWIAYHIFVLLQNLGMLLFWYVNHYSGELLYPDWYLYVLISIVVGGMVVGTLLTFFYYKCLHPSETYVMEVKKIGPELEKLKKKYTKVDYAKSEALFESSI